MLPILTFVDPTSIWERQKGGVQSRLPPQSVTSPHSPHLTEGQLPAYHHLQLQPGSMLIPRKVSRDPGSCSWWNSTTRISIQAEDAWAGQLDAAAGNVAPGRSTGRGTYRVLEVRGHAHAQLHLLDGEIQLLTHLLPQRQQHLGERRNEKVTRLVPATPAQLQGFTDNNFCLSLRSPSHRRQSSHISC